MSTTTYKYAKLPALRDELRNAVPYIRLLRLLPPKDPSNRDETIRCVLSPAQLDDVNTSYTAISYMWGRRDADQVIELNKASFSVTENLWTCLRKFRNHRDDNNFWVDAICINQEDSDERSSQVSQMGTIYAKAQEVVIWPRDPMRKLENASVLRAMNFVRTIVESKQNNISFATHFLSFYQDPECDERWSELAALCQTEYWSRVWIVQETVLASKVILHGEDDDENTTSSLDWKDFMQVCQALANLPVNWPISKTALAIRESLPLRLESRRSSSSKVSPIESLLAIFEDSKCSEPRDKIYGLLSLAENWFRSAITVNYSMSMFEVYVDVVWAYDARKYLASQICSFSQLVQRTLKGPFPRHSGVKYDRSDLELLRLRALSKGAILPLDIFPGASIRQAVASRKRLEALRSCFQSLVYTMGDIDTYLANALDQLEQVPPEYLAAIESSSSYVSGPQYLSNPTLPTNMAFKPPQNNGKTRLFLGMNGEIGLAASCIREDDILCQFESCDVAAIVRPEGDKYQIISRAVIAKGNGEGEIRQDKLSPVSFKYNVPNLLPGGLYANSTLEFHVDGLVFQALTCPLNPKSALNRSDIQTQHSFFLGTSTP
jgi:hypothetical protein